MRNVQISIQLELTNEQTINGEKESYHVYADSNNIWEAICAGFDELIGTLKEKGHLLPAFGRRQHS